MARRKSVNLSNEERILLVLKEQATAAEAMHQFYADQATHTEKITKNLESAVDLQIKIRKGQSVGKQIDDNLLRNQAKRDALAKKIRAMKKAGLDIDMKELGTENKKLKVEKEILEEQKKQTNTLEYRAKQAAASAKKLMKSYIGTAAMVATIYKGIMEMDKMQTQYNKTFGLSNEQAMDIQDRFSDIANASGRMSITFMTLHKTMQGIAEATGLLATTMRSDVIEEAAELSKLMGLSNKGMANLALNAQRTGQNMEEQSLEMVRGVAEAEKMLGVNIDVNAAFKTASETTGLIRANLGRSYGEITRVVTKAQALGMTLQDLASISQNMLNFQSSIEAELTAELFLGKQLNLEKARLFALTGDYEGLQREIVGQLGSEYEFLSLNVLQKQKYAAALGMSVDQMSNLVMRNADLAALEMEAEARNDTQTLEMLKQRTIQEQLADITEKMTMTFISLAEGPLGSLINGLSTLLQSSTALYGIMVAIAAIKLGGLISSMATLAATTGVNAAAAAWSTGLMTMGIGLLVVAPIVAAIMASMKKDKAAASQIKTRRFQNLGETEMVTLESGTAMFDAGESVVRTENFKNMTDGLDRIEQAILGQKLEVYTESHHGTRYR
jgi:hypothetical protein